MSRVKSLFSFMNLLAYATFDALEFRWHINKSFHSIAGYLLTKSHTICLNKYRLKYTVCVAVSIEHRWAYTLTICNTRVTINEWHSEFGPAINYTHKRYIYSVSVSHVIELATCWWKWSIEKVCASCTQNTCAFKSIREYACRTGLVFNWCL